jgi:AraC-like DNA-binding protein
VWRQRVRFHDAVEALAAGQPIAQVARQNGYRSGSAFSAACRKTMGAAPSAIRIASPH